MAKDTAKTSNDKKIKILLVDDHPIVRQGVRTLISHESDMVVCGEADNSVDALRLMDQTCPDIAVVDLSLKESTGLDLIKDARIRYPKILVLVYSMRDESFYAERVLRAGAKGYITKEEGGKMIIDGISKILDGQIFLSERMAAKMVWMFVGGGGAARPSIQNLTDRELEVFELIGHGMPTREIAEKRHLSVKTVDSYREHIKEKLKLDSAAELLKHAIEWVKYEGKG